jgi:FtsZ-interacting cell division protein YlmF
LIGFALVADFERVADKTWLLSPSCAGIRVDALAAPSAKISSQRGVILDDC